MALATLTCSFKFYLLILFFKICKEMLALVLALQGCEGYKHATLNTFESRVIRFNFRYYCKSFTRKEEY